MSDQPADSPALAPPPRSEGWTRNKFIFLIALALGLHVALIFIFGTKKPIVPRAVGPVPHLRLADRADEFIALTDPTLFALPHLNDFVTPFWTRPPLVAPPANGGTESAQFLPLANAPLGAAFRTFMQTNQPPPMPLDFKPEPKLSEPVVAFDAAPTPATTMKILGELARRPLLNQIELPAIPLNDVIAPSKVQVLVNPAGSVASVVLLADNPLEATAHDDAADQRALQLALRLRFAPAARVMLGEIVFHWHTLPVPATTNAP